MQVGTPTVATHLLCDPNQYLTPVGSFLRKFSLDELLDKVHRRGLDSLSKKERQLLDKYSRNS
jgi:hypothetical protein